ncbi:hypothetical protein TNIN_426451 [Trichonephila inaurata madagascariensis]|uniref:Uncharacterized protein n=1 Tax=Trichonephila inaurata madagascariensis TaxID=2747483 RepID=A0A8X7BSL8_9ARAC|nr:hypothetical protein TNIN_426451 [Trichonephila inaurata madagascariensis]
MHRRSRNTKPSPLPPKKAILPTFSIFHHPTDLSTASTQSDHHSTPRSLGDKGEREGGSKVLWRGMDHVQNHRIQWPLTSPGNSFGFGAPPTKEHRRQPSTWTLSHEDSRAGPRTETNPL